MRDDAWTDQDREQRALEAVRRWNPWWLTGAEFPCGVRRDALDSVRTWLGETEILAICGMRRVGKTVLMNQVVRDLIRTGRARPNEVMLLNLEDPAFIEVKEKGREHLVLERMLDLFIRDQRPADRPWLLLDEVQNIPGWARWVRAAAETGRAAFVVSGSSSRLLEPDLATVLTGRSITFTLWPLGLTEFARFLAPTAPQPVPPLQLARLLPEYLSRGGMPGAVLEPDHQRRRERLVQLFRDLIYRDVVHRHEVRKVPDLEALAHHYLAATAQLSSYQSIKHKYGLAIDQVRSYAAHLEEAYLLGTLQRHAFKAHQRSRDPRKVYARDTGLRNAVSFRSSPDLGPLAETAVFNHLSRNPENQLFYYRDTKTDAECDFVVRRAQRAVAVVQVCYAEAAALPPRELKGLAAAMEALGLEEGWLLTADGEPDDLPDLPLAGKVVRQRPLWRWLAEPPDPWPR